MLEIQGLSKKYGDYLAVDHVSFTVPTGKIGNFAGTKRSRKIYDYQKYCRFAQV